MSDMMSWFLAAGVLVILELFVGTFYLLMVAVGILAGGIAAAAGAPLSVQALVAALIGIVATLLLRRRSRKASAARDPNVSLDIGQSVTVGQWQDGTARVMYRGALWDVELAHGGNPAAGQYTIREIRGSRLIVS